MILRYWGHCRFDVLTTLRTLMEIDGWWKLSVFGHWRFVYCIIPNPKLSTWKSTLYSETVLQLERVWVRVVEIVTKLLKYESTYKTPIPWNSESFPDYYNYLIHSLVKRYVCPSYQYVKSCQKYAGKCDSSFDWHKIVNNLWITKFWMMNWWIWSI